MSKYNQQWFVLVILFLAWGIIGLARNGINYLFPFVQSEFGVGSEHMGFIAATLAIFWAGAIILSGKYYSKLGPTKIMVSGLILAAVFSGLAAATKHIGFIYGCMAVVGFGAGTVCIPSLSMIAQYSDPRNRGTFMGVMQSAFQLIGVAGGSVALTYLGESMGWKSSFVILGAVIAGFAVVLFFSLKRLSGETVKKEEKKVEADISTKEIFAYRNMKIASFLTCCCMIWSFTIPAYAIIYLVEVKAFSAIQAGVIFSGFGIGGFLGNIIGPSLSDFLGRKYALIMASILNVICFGAFVVLDASPMVLSVLLFLAALFFYGISPIIITVIPSETVPDHLVAKATSFTPSIGEIFGGVLAPVLVGLFIGVIGLDLIMKGLAIIPLSIFILGFWVEETAPRVLARRTAN